MNELNHGIKMKINMIIGEKPSVVRINTMNEQFSRKKISLSSKTIIKKKFTISNLIHDCITVLSFFENNETKKYIAPPKVIIYVKNFENQIKKWQTYGKTNVGTLKRNETNKKMLTKRKKNFYP